MEWQVVDIWGAEAVVAVCVEKWFADAIVARYPNGFEVRRLTLVPADRPGAPPQVDPDDPAAAEHRR